MTFKELGKWYLDLERVKALPSYRQICIRLNGFNAVYGDTIINRLKVTDLENSQMQRIRKGLASSTIDDQIGAVQTMVSDAVNNDLIGADSLKPFKRTKKLLKHGANARNRILSPEEFRSLLNNAPQYLQHILMVGYYTGMRSGEILSLTWNKVDLKARCIYLIASDTKDKEPRAIPICNDLYQTVHTIPRAIHDTHVFLYRGRPIKDFEKALATACDKAGIIYGKNISGGFIFHDLRHTFNTYMRKAGVAESIIMKITGHSTRQMFDRYNTIDAEDTTKGINQMEAFLQSSDQNSDQTLKNKS